MGFLEVHINIQFSFLFFWFYSPPPENRSKFIRYMFHCFSLLKPPEIKDAYLVNMNKIRFEKKKNFLNLIIRIKPILNNIFPHNYGFRVVFVGSSSDDISTIFIR